MFADDYYKDGRTPAQIEKIFQLSLRSKGATNSDDDETLENFYSLNYYAARTHFHAHQRQTLRLAELLKNKFDTNDDKPADPVRIAVLGGGIGGLTCFLELHALGLRNTHLFEQRSAPMGVQRNCMHRHGHPTANGWPKEPISATTDLPFMNWGAGTAHDVIEQMDNDPALPVLQTKLKYFIHHNRVVSNIRRNRGQWTFDVNNDPSEPNLDEDNRTFDVIIHALGFGHEIHGDSSRADDYWWNDNLENFLEDRARFGKKRKFVSGFGDGAMIDAARIGFGLDPGDNPIPRIIAAARHEDYHQAPQKIEPDMMKGKKSPFEKTLFKKIDESTSADIMTPFNDCVMSVKEKDEGTPLWKVISDFEDRAKKMAQINPRNSATRLVRRTTSEETRKPASGNMFLLAILDRLGEQSLKIKEGELRPGGDADIGRIHLPDEHEEHDRGASYNKSLFFVRHGTGGISKEVFPEIEGKEPILLPEVERETSSNKRGHDRYDFLLGHGLIDKDDVTKEVVTNNYRTHCATDFVRRRLTSAYVSYAEDDDGVPHVIINAPISMETSDNRDSTEAIRNRDAIVNIGGFDRQMFGMPVVYRNTDSGEGMLAARSDYKRKIEG